jgi:hypothetical protein
VTCRLHGIDQYTCLVDVQQRISEHPASRIAELTPRLWKQRFAVNPLRSEIQHLPVESTAPPFARQSTCYSKRSTRELKNTPCFAALTPAAHSISGTPVPYARLRLLSFNRCRIRTNGVADSDLAGRTLIPVREQLKFPSPGQSDVSSAHP